MLNTALFAQLLHPLVFRAQADGSASPTGFYDRAAMHLLTRLRFNNKRDAQPQNRRQREHMLERCHWIDQQAQQFFERYPKGRGIEINAGLSTRFHRLSYNADWPQFSWQTVNQHEVAQYIKRLFPQLDNYSALGCQDPLRDWCKAIDWRDKIPKLVIIDETQPISTSIQWQALCHGIFAHLKDTSPTIHLLLSHTLHDIKKIVKNVSEGEISVLCSAPKRSANSKIMSKFAALFTAQARSRLALSVDHIVFGHHSNSGGHS